jgi:serine/threonine protein kinase
MDRNKHIGKLMSSNLPSDPLSYVQWSRIDELCNRFEAAHHLGSAPEVEAYLTEVEKPLRMSLLKELLQIDSHYKTDPKHDAARLTQLFPELDRATLTRLLSQNAAKKSSGQFPVVEGYTILSELGRGGMGVVYKARDLRLDRFVALKMMHLEGPNREQVVVRMLTEARAAAHLQHPNLVPIYEVRECEGCPVLVFEYVDGGTLAERIARQPIDPDIAAHMMETLAKVLAYAHSRGIVHRDLKPANILITHDGTLKVSDFGLARQLNDDKRQTKSGMLIGTPGYMAPEQASGNLGQLGPAADIHGLGAILYEMLSGQPAFRGTSILETLEMVRTQDPVPPRRLRRSVPRDLETICLKCLRKNPDERYLSASLLSAELGRYLKQEPIMARPLGRLEQVNRWCRRNPREAVLASLFLFVSVACFLAVLWAWQKTKIAFEIERTQSANEKLLNEEAQKIAIASNRRFDKAAASAEELLRVSQRLLNQPGMDTLGRETFEKAMKFKQSLIEEGSGSDGMSFEIARALGGFAVTQGELGLYREALVTLQQAIAAIQSLDESARESLDSQREMISLLLRQVGVLSHLDRQDEASEVLRQGVILGERLLQSNPTGGADMVRLANLLVNASIRSVTVEDKKSQLRRAVGLEQNAITLEPNNEFFRFELALSLESLAVILFPSEAGHAKELMQESVINFENSLSTVGVPRVSAFYFSRATRTLARMHVREKQFEKASTVLQKGFDVIQTTAKSFPNYGDGRTENANAMLEKARLLLDLGEPVRADAMYSDAMREVTEIVRLFPEDQNAYSANASVATDWSKRLEVLERYQESAEVQRETILQCRIWREKDPKKQVYDARIGEAFQSMVRLSKKCDESTRQLILAAVNELLIGDADIMNLVAWYLVLPKLANDEDGVVASALAGKAVAMQPKNAAFQNTLGLALYRAGKMPEARSALENSLSLNTAWAGADWCILAMVDQREGNLVNAAANLKKATQWNLDKKQNDKDLTSLEAEAQALIEGTQQ